VADHPPASELEVTLNHRRAGDAPPVAAARGGYRDLLGGAMDVYLSTVSNRLNTVMKQLAVIATIFLPLSWLTGFFGQNFGFEIKHIGGPGTLVALGLGSELLALAILLVYFKRRGWF
jgi:magnesium transporter